MKTILIANDEALIVCWCWLFRQR